MKSITERHEAAMVEAQKTCRSRPLERLKRGCVHKGAVGDLVRVALYLISCVILCFKTDILYQ